MFIEDNSASLIEDRKPMLDTSEMIQHLKERGVKFEIVSEEDAYTFLEQNNNYFKLTAYRKNFETHSSGDRKGQYINLDFAALQELSTIDMRLRYILLHMCLDIEHFIKVDLIRTIQSCNKADAYNIVSDFISNQQKWHFSDPKGTDYIDKILKEARKDVYRKDLVQKYEDCFPVWVFAEIIHFSDLIELYMFVLCRYICKQCTELKEEGRLPSGCYPISNGSISAYKAYKITNNKENDQIRICPQIRKKVEHLDRLLQDVRQIRNAAAHNSCFLNDLRIPAGSGADDLPSPLVIKGFEHIFQELKTRMPGITMKGVRRVLKNERLKQLYSVLYAHRLLVQSQKIKDYRWKELRGFTSERLYRGFDKYNSCSSIVKSFGLLKNTVDLWSEI